VKPAWRALWLSASLLAAGPAPAADAAAGAVVQVETRGVTVPVFALWDENAVATVVLFSGGAGGYGRIGEGGWPASRNFLIRSAKLFAAHPFNLVLVGRATDVAELDGETRIGDRHDEDNRAIFRLIKVRSAAPLWLVGTSMGTISATAAAIRDEGANIAGIVLTSSVTAYRVRGAVPTQDLAKIRVPVLVMHHARDACRSCTPWEAKNIFEGLKNAPVRKFLLVEGGEGATGDPCEALHHHGYIGMERQAVDLIANWILRPAP
jgi:pimeloyl-ACP methyl ester carboxylesterase